MKPLIAAGTAYIQDELGQVEQLLQERLGSEIPAVADLGRYLAESRGKRFRPALTLFFYRLLGGKGARRTAVELAAIVEMIHVATLTHDDVIDQSEARRDRPALWVRSSNRSAVLEGDFIFSRAFRMLNAHPFEVRELVIDAVEDLLEGELLQESLRLQLPTVEEYDQVIERKTGALIGAACTLGAMTGDPQLSEERRGAVRRAGRLLGTAYQMIDDLLDVFGDETLGKPRWTDQRGGWLTWPYIQLVRESGEAELEARLLNREMSEAERRDILNRMRGRGIDERFTERARDLTVNVREDLAWVPDSKLKDLFFDGLESVIHRRS